MWGARFGWERPNWFAPGGAERKDIYSFRRSNWFEPVGKEVRGMRESVGLLELSSFSKFEVEGARARDGKRRSERGGPAHGHRAGGAGWA